MWVFDAKYLWFVWLANCFLFCLSDYNIRHHFLCFLVKLELQGLNWDKASQSNIFKQQKYHTIFRQHNHALSFRLILI